MYYKVPRSSNVFHGLVTQQDLVLSGALAVDDLAVVVVVVIVPYTDRD
jgi:hypothetical protein